LPCFHAIARTFSSHRRVLLTNALTSVRASSAQSVLEGTGLIDEVIYYPVADFTLKNAVALIRELRRLRPVTMIYMAERKHAAPVYRDLLFFKAAGVSKIVGAPWNRDLRECRIDPDTQELEYEAERLARMLRTVVPVTLGRQDWDLRLSASELTKAEAVLSAVAPAHSLLAIAPGAKTAAKDWGADNWAALMESLAVPFRHFALVLVGAPDERALSDDVARRWAGPVVNLCGMLTPRETAAVLRRCRLMVCHDSGPMHLAASQQTPCVALFGSINRPHQWYPFGSGHHVIHEPRGIREIAVQRVAEITARAASIRFGATTSALISTFGA
jgi:heptosyltransferase-3